MRKLINSNTVIIDGLELPILTHDGKYNCFDESLPRIKRELDSMLSHHRKVFVFRIDMRVERYTGDNKVITKFLRSFIPWLKRRYDLKRVGYVWCREVETAKKQHYHLVFMIDGTAVKTMKTITDKVKDIAFMQDLSPWIPKSPSYLIERKHLEYGDYTKYKEAFRRASYIAKERGKKVKGKKTNSFQTSRVQPRLNEHGEVFKAGDDYQKRLNKKEI